MFNCYFSFYFYNSPLDGIDSAETYFVYSAIDEADIFYSEPFTKFGDV